MIGGNLIVDTESGFFRDTNRQKYIETCIGVTSVFFTYIWARIVDSLGFLWHNALVGWSDVVADLLFETALHHPCVESSEQDFFAISFEPHLLHACSLVKVLELDPVFIALWVERSIFDSLDWFLSLPADNSTLTPFCGFVWMFIEWQAIERKFTSH